MRLFDKVSEDKLDSVLVMLTREELRGCMEALANLDSRGEGAHEHVYDVGYSHDITLVLYEEGRVPEGFHPRMAVLIRDDA